jgi:asparagine synthase (glutamine-hydrolysing)
MCGIAAIVGTGASEAAVSAMVGALGHRGPDDRGAWVSGDVALGHTRLAIIDPGPAGHQPFVSGDGIRVCTYNGEIYDYPDLRGAVPNLRTHCDTELFVETADAGDAAFRRSLRGMYAYVVVDQTTGAVLATRDPLGIKPLYCAETDAGVVLASELRAMLASGLVDTDVDPAAVVDVLRYGAVVQPWTALRAVRRIRPGAVLRVAGGHTVEDDDLVEDPPPPASDLAAAVRQSVAAHLLADVEVGLFLSGGVDSSLIARCLHDLGSPTRALTLRVGGLADEVGPARETATAYGLDFDVVDVSEEECLQMAVDYFDAMDAPAADGLNVYLVARAAADCGLKVCLSGTGGDELFGGYRIARQLQRIGSLFGRSPQAMRSRAAGGIDFASRRRAARRLAAAIDLAGSPARLTDLSHRVFLEADVAELVDVEPDSHRRLAPDDRVGYLRDILLADADVFGMAHGVEIRLPFVDRRLDAAVAAHGVVDKRAVVESFDDPVLARRLRAPKAGFSVPLERWLRGPLAAVADRLCDGPPACLASIVREEPVVGTYHAWRSGLGPSAMEIWTLIALYQWGDRHDRRLER